MYEEFELLREYGKKEVIITSPSTLCTKLELIKAGIHVKKISERADSIIKEISALKDNFSNLDNLWKTFDSNLKIAVKNAQNLKKTYEELKDKFERISNFYEE